MYEIRKRKPLPDSVAYYTNIILLKSQLRILFFCRNTFRIPSADSIVFFKHNIQLADFSFCRSVLQMFSQKTRRKGIFLNTCNNVEFLLQVPDTFTLKQDIFV